MNNKEYWENRAAREMYEEMIPAEQAAQKVNVLYKKVYKYIENRSKGIFDAFTNQTGLTEEQARYYIQNVAHKDIHSLMVAIEQIQDKAIKEELKKWIKASATQNRLYRLFEVEQEMDLLFVMLFKAELAIHEKTYTKIIQDSYLKKLFEIQQQANIAWKVGPLQAAKVEKLMMKPWYGGNFSQKLWGNTDALAEKVKEELIVSFLTGKTEFDSWKEIDAIFNKGAKAAHRLIRTESSYMVNQAQLESYKNAGIEKYIFVATLDLKTSEVCRSLDGKSYKIEFAKAGTNYPPMHPWCRSTTIAYLPEKLLQKMKRTARDPKTGKNYKVPANMTYKEWYQKYVVEVQNENQSN